MRLLNIKVYPDYILKKKAKIITDIDDNLKELVKDMTYTMYNAKGIGLAAPQIGILSRLIVYDISNSNNKLFNALINPKILYANEEIVSTNEGCLSIPNFNSNVKRFDKIIVEGIDINGKTLTIEATGILSLVLQHEIDHLNGKLLIDSVSPLKRNIYKKQILKYFKTKR